MSGKVFSFDTVSEFDSHIEMSVPNYIHIHELILNISSYFITNNTNVYDLGCSTGFLLKKIKHKHQDKNIHYFGYDISDNLLSNSEDKLFFIKQDITEDNLLFKNTDLILSIFTLQFLSVTNRTKILKKVYDSLNKGGCFILTEKIYMSDGFIQDIYNFTHYDIKRKEFKSEDILNKQVTLREIMKPLTDNENKCVLKKAGFKYVESFFQSLNFKGWICIK